MEQIYTIPINEKFDESRNNPECGCPLCTLYRMLEENEVDLIMGASMMEPDIRIVTNKLGFCATHYEMMLRLKNRLSLALTLESHLDELREDIKGNFIVKAISPMSTATSRIERLEGDCYVCKRVENNFRNVISNVIYMWESDEEFRDVLAHFGKTEEQVKADSERDKWLSAEEAKEYGIVDKVIYQR